MAAHQYGRLVAGVDTSTQSCKIVIVDSSTREVVRIGRAPHPEGTSVHPDAWWDAFLAAVVDVGGLADVEAISVAGQQHGFVPLDDRGEVIREALLWNDTRSAAAAEELRAEVGAAEYAHRTGVVPVPSFTITKLRWFVDNEPELARRLAAIALPHDWLTWRLRGYGPGNPDLSALTTDASDASGTGYVTTDLERDGDLLDRAVRGDSGHLVLPTILPPGHVAGTTAALPEAPGIPAGLPIGVGCGDNAGSALGLDAHAGDLIVSIGTSGVVCAVSESLRPDTSGVVAGFRDASGGWLPLIATLNAGRVLDTTAALLGVGHAEFSRLALAADPGAGGLVLRPYFDGERTPNLPHTAAALTGMTHRATSRENLARAAVNGVLCGLADGRDAVAGTGVDVRRALLIGGGARNEALQRAAAQIFGIPIEVPEPGEYVALGAAVQAAWAITGERPSWPRPGTEVAADPVPEIRAHYMASPIPPGPATPRS
ncbi:xylulokinase [Pseudactinotalea sp. HY158]|uniref:xylulokinase n=1 Tax=Pseudactinotalea sp. HY158 TaxID=2654547 RepID=UPI00129CA851|nr:xylulokinase [Pseudactinotalea sp. HY158]QGH70761.1 xylulokinase [Pseudactinotalea sp. HY158]